MSQIILSKGFFFEVQAFIIKKTQHDHSSKAILHLSTWIPPTNKSYFYLLLFFSRSTEVTIFIMLSLLFFVCVSHLFVWIGPREKKLLNRIEPYLRQSKDTIYGQTIVYKFFSLSTQVSALFDKFRINLYTLK